MLLQQINTISTLFLTKYIDTGDKIMDATLVSTILIILSSVLITCYTSWYTIYNMIIYYLYKMWKNPLDLSKNPPYIFNIKKYEDSSEFIKNIKHKERIYIHSFVKYLIKNGINTNNLLLDKNNKLLENDSMYRVNIPISVTYNGSVIYLAVISQGDLLENRDKKSYGYLLFESKPSSVLLDLIITHIDDIIAKDTNNIDTQDDIYKAVINPSSLCDLRHIGKISKHKIFDSLFFTQKDDLIQILNKFITRTLYPSHIPIDNKLGILLYGPPGTGKTGTISAIANMVNRSIISINFTEIRTCSQLDYILKPANYSKYVFVFDEFDCILDAMSSFAVEETKQTDWGALLMASEGEERANILKMIKESSKKAADAPINLAYLLQKLDGLESAEDRLIIATTNHPDKINKALLRPGRFDLKLCLGLCTSKMLIDILTHYYKSNTLATINKIKQCSIPENKISPLELINMAIQTPNLDTLLKKLKSIK